MTTGTAATQVDATTGDTLLLPGQRELRLSAAAVNFGHEPTSRRWRMEPEADASHALLRATVYRNGGHGCAYCGVPMALSLDSLDDNHLNCEPENLVAACFLCHAWHHLELWEAGQASVVYLPSLHPQEVVWLQWMVAAVWHGGTPSQREEAKNVLEWMGSHKRYVDRHFLHGVASPQVVAQLIQNLSPELRQFKDAIFMHHALVMSPAVLPVEVIAELRDRRLADRWVHEGVSLIRRVRGI